MVLIIRIIYIFYNEGGVYMKNIEKAREVRLWIRDIIFPVTLFSGLILSNPNVRAFIKEKKDNIKRKTQERKFKVIYGEKVEQTFSLYFQKGLIIENEENEISKEELKNENLHPKARYIECDEETQRQVKLIRFAFSEFYNCMDETLKPSRATSLVYTKLEEAQMWAIKSITHNKEIYNNEI